MTATEVILASQKECAMLSIYRYVRQDDKRSGKAKTAEEREHNRRGNGGKE